MNPPDVYDAEGRPYEGPERRHDVRRAGDDTPTPEVALGVVAWVVKKFSSQLRLGVAVAFLSSGGTYVMTALGAPRDVRQLRADVKTSDSLRAERTARIEGAVAAATARIESLEKADETKMYLLCVLVRRSDPLAAPRQCGDILQRGSTQ